MNKEISQHIFQSILLMLLLCPLLLAGQELLPMPEPTHTETGVPCTNLTVVKEIESDFDEDLFFAFPWRLTVGKADKEGRFHFYVYDAKLFKIFIFNEKYKYTGQFLEQGQGPGEVLPGNGANKHIYAAPDGNLYVAESIANKIIQFSETGKHLKDMKMHWKMKADGPFPPVVDKNGFFYKYSTGNGLVDKLDGKMNPVHTFLDKKLNSKFVVFKANHEKYYRHGRSPGFWQLPNTDNTMYDMTSDGHLLIYLFRSSTAYIFKGKKLVRQFNALIDSVLPEYRKKGEKAIREQKKLGQNILREEIMFSGCFVDQDEPYFYLEYIGRNKNSRLFKFDLDGKLVQVIKIKFPIYAKRHGLFFGLAGGFQNSHPVILKKEDTK